MKGWLLAAAVLLLIGFVLYCMLRLSAKKDRQAEDYWRKQKRDAENEDNAGA